MSSVLDQRVPVVEEGEPGPLKPSIPARTLAFDMQKQRQSEWCWAAVSTSVSLFYDPESGWTQCSVVNAGLKETTCCKDGGSDTCNQPWQLELALGLVGHLNRDFGERLPMEAIAQEIDRTRPIGLCIDWTGGGGHFVVVDGYDRKAGKIDIKDPLFGHSVVAYDSFPGSYQGGGTWSWTYLTT